MELRAYLQKNNSVSCFLTIFSKTKRDRQKISNKSDSGELPFHIQSQQSNSTVHLYLFCNVVSKKIQTKPPTNPIYFHQSKTSKKCRTTTGETKVKVNVPIAKSEHMPDQTVLRINKVHRICRYPEETLLIVLIKAIVMLLNNIVGNHQHHHK